MRYRGEITVFLSLAIICVLSLVLGLVESARTAGARLYLRMASDSAVSSVMSYYNRNLWDRYQLLFLEYESEAAIKETFGRYLDFYLEQANMYPARRENVTLSGMIRMVDEDGKWLEEEIADYMKYRIPELAVSGSGLLKEAEQVKKAGDFRTLYDSCRGSGRAVRRLEKVGQEIEKSLRTMEETREKLCDAADEERTAAFKRHAVSLRQELKGFPGLVERFQRELERLKAENQNADADQMGDETASGTLAQEISACSEVIKSAEDRLTGYREMEVQAERNRELLEEACELLDLEADAEDEDEEETDWGSISQCVEEMEIFESTDSGPKDKKKAAALDRLEELFDKELLDILLPAGTEISQNAVSLKGIPSAPKYQNAMGSSDLDGAGLLETASRQIAVNAYVPLYFSSFLEESGSEPSVLKYEMEYLLAGKKSDRENLKDAVNRVLTLRGAMNLLFLLNSPDKKAEVDALAAAVSVGIMPAQMALSFFILTLWAFGEAVLDAKTLLAGGKVPFWKTEGTWKTSLSGLLDQSFLRESGENSEDGRSYTEYLSCLMFLMDRKTRNFRMMDLIQWNIRTKQADFSAANCAYQIELETEVLQKHMFFQKEEYKGMVYAAGSY